jgi:hypothetical protein
MKSFAQVAGLSVVLAIAGFVSGCSSTPSTSTYRQPAQDFEVVESSAQRPLTDAELAEVRASVAAYLDREGATEGGDYYLKVFLKPENVDADSEWVVVRFTRYTTQRVSVVASYPYDNYLYSPYYAYDLYPWGYGSVTRISFQFYVDPFYHQHYYYPYYGRGGHKGGHKRDHDTAHNHGNKPDNHGDGRPGDGKGGPRTPGVGYAGYRPPIREDNPPSSYNRYNPDTAVRRRNPDATNADGRPNRRDNPQGDWRHRRPRDTDNSDVANNGNNSATPNPTPNTGTPAPTPPRQRPVNPTASNPTSGNPQPQWRHRNPNTNPAPNAGPNNNMNRAPRTADRVAPTQQRTQQVARPAPPSHRPAPSTVRSTPSPQPAPQRSYTPSNPSPSRPAPSSGGNSDRPTTRDSREVLR